MHSLIKTTLLLLTLTITFFAVFLLIRGAPFTSIEEGAPLTEAIITYERPYVPTLFPILGSLLIVGGVWRNKLLVAWLGAGILMVFSVLFVISWGGIFLLPALILAVLLAGYHRFLNINGAL